MNLKMIDNRILLKADKQEEVSKGGIIIPQTVESHDAARYGTVIAVGPGKLSKEGVFLPMQYKPGDKIAYAHNTAMPLTIDGEKLWVIIDSNAVAIVESPDGDSIHATENDASSTIPSPGNPS